MRCVTRRRNSPLARFKIHFSRSWIYYKKGSDKFLLFKYYCYIYSIKKDKT